MPCTKTVIYLDVLLLTNFVLTVFFLLAAGLLAGVECRAGRLLLGGVAGAAASLALLAPEAPDAAALLYKVSTAALTVAAAYGWPGWRCFARLTGWFWAGSLLLTGALLLPGAQGANGCIYLPLSPGVLLIGAVGVWLAARIAQRILGRGGGEAVFPLRLALSGTELTLRAFCDTGFSAREPLSGREVILVRLDAAAPRLPDALRTYLTGYFAGASPCRTRRWGVRFVPCTTVAGHCLLPRRPGPPAALFRPPSTPPSPTSPLPRGLGGAGGPLRFVPRQRHALSGSFHVSGMPSPSAQSADTSPKGRGNCGSIFSFS